MRDNFSRAMALVWQFPFKTVHSGSKLINGLNSRSDTREILKIIFHRQQGAGWYTRFLAGNDIYVYKVFSRLKDCVMRINVFFEI